MMKKIVNLYAKKIAKLGFYAAKDTTPEQRKAYGALQLRKKLDLHRMKARVGVHKADLGAALLADNPDHKQIDAALNGLLEAKVQFFTTKASYFLQARNLLQTEKQKRLFTAYHLGMMKAKKTIAKKVKTATHHRFMLMGSALKKRAMRWKRKKAKKGKKACKKAKGCKPGCQCPVCAAKKAATAGATPAAPAAPKAEGCKPGCQCPVCAAKKAKKADCCKCKCPKARRYRRSGYARRGYRRYRRYGRRYFTPRRRYRRSARCPFFRRYARRARRGYARRGWARRRWSRRGLRNQCRAMARRRASVKRQWRKRKYRKMLRHFARKMRPFFKFHKSLTQEQRALKRALKYEKMRAMLPLKARAHLEHAVFVSMLMDTQVTLDALKGQIQKIADAKGAVARTKIRFHLHFYNTLNADQKVAFGYLALKKWHFKKHVAKRIKRMSGRFRKLVNKKFRRMFRRHLKKQAASAPAPAPAPTPAPQK